MKKLIAILLLICIILPVTTAALSSLGTFRAKQNVTLLQLCDDCTYNNITSVVGPRGNALVSNVNMTQDSTTQWSWVLNHTYVQQIGEYRVNGVGNEGGTLGTWEYTFEVTPSGFIGTFQLYIIILAILAGIIILGFSISEPWFVVLGGMGFILLGVYSLNSGIVGFQDMFMTYAISLFEIGVGTILAIGAGMQKMNYD
jgi:hypothetical protein